MPRIILSLALIALTAGALILGGTTAFFSDTETSAANVFAAGAIDLQIDNASYYNGVFNEGTSWAMTDLTETEKFFDFADLKPADYGEDTISIHIDNNDAYLCADVTLTSNDDNTQTEPESLVDANGLTTGELANLVNFIWWADDGDNVLENDEQTISNGPIGALTLGVTTTIALADTVENIWTGVPGPIAGGEIKFIGKAWCFGALASQPLIQDGVNDVRTPADDNDGDQVAGTPEDGGYSCDGSALGNESQTDSLTADIGFSAVQARHNERFQCVGPTGTGESCEISEVLTLIPDSGFENPEVTSTAQWDVFSSPAAAWNVLWRDDIPATFGAQTRPNPARLELHEGVLGSAYEGNQYAELDSDWGGPADTGNGEPASVTIYQDIPTTPGKTYRIKFAFAPRPNTAAAENKLEVRWGGDPVFDSGNVADGNSGIEWQPQTFDVLATTTTTRLQFSDLGTANSLGTFLDDIKLFGEVCE